MFPLTTAFPGSLFTPRESLAAGVFSTPSVIERETCTLYPVFARFEITTPKSHESPRRSFLGRT